LRLELRDTRMGTGHVSPLRPGGVRSPWSGGRYGGGVHRHEDSLDRLLHYRLKLKGLPGSDTNQPAVTALSPSAASVTAYLPVTLRLPC
jgi:hypothetical protein